jgi:DNA-binding CsgD family transcriptional regulator
VLVPELRLSRCDVSGIRQLLVVDETADERERWAAVLGTVARLIPSDWLGIGVADGTGCLEHALSMPDDVEDDLDPQVCDGPLPVGIQHVADLPEDDEDRVLLRSQGIRDTLRAGFPVGQGRVVQLYLDRTHRCFDARDVMLLSMIEPVLGRLLRPGLYVDRLHALSGAERRVLTLVAEGGSNNDVAAQLMVSEATVRKHLEHTYRKLGVANRTAASALVHVGPTG